ncbi:MAG TPA: hypothetical protein VGH51_06445 [Candidatus Angelobacter sp.]
MDLKQLVENTLAVFVKLFALWFPCWAIRRAGEFDEKLDGTMRAVRWTIVIICFAWIGQLRPEDISTRLVLSAIGLPFFCWPNCAYHLVRLFRPAKHEDIHLNQ